MSSEAGTSSGEGRGAQKPSEIPKRGWFDVAKRVKHQIKDDHVAIIAAGIAFFFFLAVFPALAAALSVYGLVVEPSEAAAQLDRLSGMLPANVHEMISGFAEKLTSQPGKALGWGVALSILVSLWSANKGTKALFQGLNIAYDEEDTRGFFKKVGLSLFFTLVAVAGGIVVMAMVAGVPAFTNMLGLGGTLKEVVDFLRWPILAALVMAFLTWVYKVAPHRDSPEGRWVTWGSAIATALWLAGSALFSYFVDNFGRFDKTYGSFAAVVVLMLWFFLTAFIILLGAEINSESEHQTATDTTTGPDQPMGQRNAFHADHVAGEHHEKEY